MGTVERKWALLNENDPVERKMARLDYNGLFEGNPK